MSRHTLIPVTILIVMVVGLVSPVVGSLVFYPTGNQALPYQVPLSLEYSLKVYNQSTSGNHTVTKLVEEALIMYQAQLLKGTLIQVHVNSNFTPLENFTPVRSGAYNLSYVLSPLSPLYPYIYPGFLSNSTSYAISTPNSYLILSYVNATNVTLMGNYYRAFIYRELSPSLMSLTVLEDGVLYQENQTHGSLNYVLTLRNFSLSQDIQTLNVTQTQGYLYSNLTYSSFSRTFQPSGYLEYVYPAEFPGGLLASAVYQVEPFQAFPLGGFTSFHNMFVNFVLNVGNMTQIPSNFVVVNGSSATWNGVAYTLVGNTLLNLSNGTVQVSVYKHVETVGNITASTTYIYVANGLLVEEEYNQSYPGGYAFKLVLIPNGYIDPNQHFPDVTGYSNDTLPYKPVHPTSAFVYTVVATLIIVAILVILHRRL